MSDIIDDFNKFHLNFIKSLKTNDKNEFDEKIAQNIIELVKLANNYDINLSEILKTKMG